MLNIEELQAKRDRFRAWATVIGLGIVGLVVAPFIFMAIGPTTTCLLQHVRSKSS